jgi:hypothetical protein
MRHPGPLKTAHEVVGAEAVDVLAEDRRARFW